MVSASPERPLRMQVLRDGQERVLDVTPGVRESGGKQIGVLGVRNASSEVVRLGPVQAVAAGAAQT